MTLKNDQTLALENKVLRQAAELHKLNKALERKNRRISGLLSSIESMQEGVEPVLGVRSRIIQSVLDGARAEMMKQAERLAKRQEAAAAEAPAAAG